MKILDRNISIGNISLYFMIFIRSIKFINPLKFFYFYLLRKSPLNIRINKNILINFSEHPHDFITFVVIFLKKEYGPIPNNYTIIDIGGNIGLFSIYAFTQQKKNQIYSFEPSLDAYKIFKKNIDTNYLNSSINLFNAAISSSENKTVMFSKESSPYNKINNSSNEGKLEVKNFNLDDFLNEKNISNNIFLKIDCEGAELEIIKSIRQKNLKQVKIIRLETHGKEISIKILDYLKKLDYIIEKNKNDIIWAKK